jgi:hypothetical protein
MFSYPLKKVTFEAPNFLETRKEVVDVHAEKCRAEYQSTEPCKVYNNHS